MFALFQLETLLKKAVYFFGVACFVGESTLEKSLAKVKRDEKAVRKKYRETS